ncbi:hypothetical protein [Bradyrhizobium sp. SZCCHNPS2010]|uniref:ImuA family protein n=1 Tax=Bradyrhizobium sp. SZCCHNPS2010 TaxID=3057333 RepID=UPI002915E9A3|nr:hypothetical protein [Bradyrhizobium sp. SZCCHNPS2010]
MALGVAAERNTLVFGIEAIDQWLPGGGLALGSVHEICEQGTDSARASLAALFAAGVLARLPGPVIWCLHSRDLFAPALARVGLHPDRVIYCETWKDAEVLPAMEEGLRHGGLAGVVGELVKLPLVSARPGFVQWKRLSAVAGGHRPRRVAMSPVTPSATTVGELWDLRHVTHDRTVA